MVSKGRKEDTVNPRAKILVIITFILFVGMLAALWIGRFSFDLGRSTNDDDMGIKPIPQQCDDNCNPARQKK